MDYQTPYKNIVPPMTDEEYSELRDDIDRNGILIPVILDDSGNVIDGHHRIRIAEELQITRFPIEIRPGLSNEEKQDMAWNLNAHRRQMSKETRREYAHALRERGLSYREIGTRMGIDPMTARSDILSGVENSTPESVLGKDGKRYPAIRTQSDRCQQVSKLLRGIPSETLAIAGKQGVFNESTIMAVERLRKSQHKPGSNGTFAEIVATGHIQPGEEHEAVHIADDPLKVDHAIHIITRDHVREARVAAICDLAGAAPSLAEFGQCFPVIYADPPWRHEFSETENRSIENHYPDMLLEEICALPVSQIASPDAILFLWSTSPKLSEAMRVIDAWGFTYRTAAVWVKDKIGLGYYFRQRHEHLLVATRGLMPTPKEADRPDSVLQYPRLAHSAKPVEVYDILERMYPEFAKIELFARHVNREGWATWGNEA